MNIIVVVLVVSFGFVSFEKRKKTLGALETQESFPFFRHQAKNENHQAKNENHLIDSFGSAHLLKNMGTFVGLPPINPT